ARSLLLDYLAPLREAEWVVYAKRPFAGPEQVLDYVGRYTHRVAISNNRLLDIAEGKVTFRYKDYRHGAQQKTMTLQAEEFIRRFLLLVLPEGFQPIRSYCFLANRTENRNWRGAESCWACRHPNHRLRKPARTIPSAMNNSPVPRCGNAQSVTKVACT